VRRYASLKDCDHIIVRLPGHGHRYRSAPTDADKEKNRPHSPMMNDYGEFLKFFTDMQENVVFRRCTRADVSRPAPGGGAGTIQLSDSRTGKTYTVRAGPARAIRAHG
jgi:hypothetical protein